MSKTIGDVEMNMHSRAGLFFPAVSVGLKKYIALPHKSGLSSSQFKNIVGLLTDRLHWELLLSSFSTYNRYLLWKWCMTATWWIPLQNGTRTGKLQLHQMPTYTHIHTTYSCKHSLDFLIYNTLFCTFLSLPGHTPQETRRATIPVHSCTYFASQPARVKMSNHPSSSSCPPQHQGVILKAYPEQSKEWHQNLINNQQQKRRAAMLQIEGNNCAWEVVHARSQHSRYVIPPFLASDPQENSRKICKRVTRACGCIEFYKSPSVPGAPKFCRQLLPQALQRMKGESRGAALQRLGKARDQPSTLRNPPCRTTDQQVPEKPTHSANLMVI